MKSSSHVKGKGKRYARGTYSAPPGFAPAELTGNMPRESQRSIDDRGPGTSTSGSKLQAPSLIHDRVIKFQINGGGLYIKWPNPLRLHHRVLDSITCFPLISTHFTYIIIMGWFDDDHSCTQAYNDVSLSLAMWCCMVLIATASSTKTPPIIRLLSVMSSLQVLLPMRFDPVVLLFSRDVQTRTRLPRHMRTT